jgi:hypothetical protein
MIFNQSILFDQISVFSDVKATTDYYYCFAVSLRKRGFMAEVFQFYIPFIREINGINWRIESIAELVVKLPVI